MLFMMQMSLLQPQELFSALILGPFHILDQETPSLSKSFHKRPRLFSENFTTRNRFFDLFSPSFMFRALWRIGLTGWKCLGCLPLSGVIASLIILLRFSIPLASPSSSYSRGIWLRPFHPTPCFGEKQHAPSSYHTLFWVCWKHFHTLQASMVGGLSLPS